ncbi:1591_t:CDS:2 [Diversispora eburnea]|uniref:1591_t:CDS:1 n=1 Tax=Diversispora eburnea TaxID=1213867 RepID=A0A9N8V6J4_9GLOM|nr:1591_t:CDS:2 [Diversispora eburnea]
MNNVYENSSFLPTNISNNSSITKSKSKDFVPPAIRLQFPPVVDLVDLISKKSPDGRIPARAPNAFIIYRKVYVETARKNGHFLPMTTISSMASQSWENEKEEVKVEYRRVAKEALKVRNEMYPKAGRRKRKDRWNIVSFEPITSPQPTKQGLKRKNGGAQYRVVEMPAKPFSYDWNSQVDSVNSVNLVNAINSVNTINPVSPVISASPVISSVTPKNDNYDNSLPAFPTTVITNDLITNISDEEYELGILDYSNYSASTTPLRN